MRSLPTMSTVVARQSTAWRLPIDDHWNSANAMHTHQTLCAAAESGGELSQIGIGI